MYFLIITQLLVDKCLLACITCVKLKLRNELFLSSEHDTIPLNVELFSHHN